MIFKTLAILAVLALSACGGGSATQSAPPVSPPAVSRPLSNVAAFMGDSITALWPLDQYDPGPTLNFGVGGNTSVQMLARFDAVVAASPGVVVILAGAGDLEYIGPAASTTDSIKAMAATASAAGIRVILCSVPPHFYSSGHGQSYSNADVEAFNQKILTLAIANGYLFADYYPVFLNPDDTVNPSLFIADGAHPTPAGYAAMWKVLEPLLTEDLN